MDESKPDVEVIQRVMVEPMSDADRQKMRTLFRTMAHDIGHFNVSPEVALTAILNIMGSIIGTQFTKEDREKWTLQITTMLPLYIEAYRTGEKRRPS